MRWAVVCSVPDERIINTLSEFATWFLEEVTVVAGRMNIYARFEKRPKVVQHVPVGDYDACATAYETIRKGVLLENALDRFASVAKLGNDASEVFANVAQWIARATSKLCLDKDPFFMTIAMSSIISSMLLPLMKEEMRLAPWIAMDLRQEVEPVKVGLFSIGTIRREIFGFKVFTVFFSQWTQVLPIFPDSLLMWFF
ncbi:hypothetical protein COOONC_26491 [Cooperia oncophora]